MQSSEGMTHLWTISVYLSLSRTSCRACWEHLAELFESRSDLRHSSQSCMPTVSLCYGKHLQNGFANFHSLCASAIPNQVNFIKKRKLGLLLNSFLVRNIFCGDILQRQCGRWDWCMVRMKRCVVGCLLAHHMQNLSAFLAPRGRHSSWILWCCIYHTYTERHLSDIYWVNSLLHYSIQNIQDHFQKQFRPTGARTCSALFTLTSFS